MAHALRLYVVTWDPLEWPHRHRVRPITGRLAKAAASGPYAVNGSRHGGHERAEDPGRDAARCAGDHRADRPGIPELLDEEYAGLARSVVAKLARKRPSPIQSGRASTWAGGVVYALGQVNFLFDPDTKPYATEFLREEMVATSPMVWFIEVDGLIMDARQLPPAIQAQAFELGVIPYIPALGRDGTAAWLSQSGR
jgi:hypothetical protein